MADVTEAGRSKEHGQRSPDSSAELGKLQLFGYQKGWLDIPGDPTTKVASMINCTRVGYTMMANLIAGYYLEYDPTTVPLVLPTEHNASDWMKDSLLSMMRDTPSLAAIQGGGAADNDKFNRFT